MSLLDSKWEGGPNPGAVKKVGISWARTPVHEQRNLLNQVKGVANQSATGAGVIPFHVNSVATSLSPASKGTTSQLAVTFKRDPTDANYQGVHVYATGYNSNSTPVLIASGTDSPITTVLNNTGERISIAVRAFGNSGHAPLETAPATSANLPLGTAGFGPTTGTAGIVSLTGDVVSGTVSAAGVATTTIAKLQGTPVSASSPTSGAVLLDNAGTWTPSAPFVSSPSIILSGQFSPYAWSNGANGAFGTSVANQVKFHYIQLPYVVKINKLAVFINAGSAASHSGFAIYDSTGATRLLTWDAIDTGTSSIARTTTLGAAVTLLPGIYLVASSSTSGSASVPTSESSYPTAGSSEPGRPWNLIQTRSGVAANASVAGVMPSSLGALSTSTGLQAMVCVGMEV